jgi:hypothetical protein
MFSSLAPVGDLAQQPGAPAMPILAHKDEDYLRRVQSAMTDALMKASMDEKSKTIVLMSGEIVTACLTILAFAAATSKAVDSPSKIREFADECAKRIRTGIAAVRKERAKGLLDWMATVHPDERH